MGAMFHSLYARTGAQLADKAPDKTFLPWPASYLDGFVEGDPEQFTLEIGGLVAKPQTFSLKDLGGFVRIQQNRRLVFADGWSYRAQWEGFVISELLHRIEPAPEARFLIQTNLAGLQECVPLKDLINQRALFCMRMAGKALPPVYGGPLHLMVFDRYAHKGLGQICKLEFSESDIPGHFAAKGYDPAGTVEPGNYYAVDLKAIREIRESGEITQW